MQGPRRGLGGTRGQWGVQGGHMGLGAPPAPTQQEEGVVLVTCRVLLWLEQRVKIPERALHEVLGGHLCEPGWGWCRGVRGHPRDSTGTLGTAWGSQEHPRDSVGISVTAWGPWGQHGDTVGTPGTPLGPHGDPTHPISRKIWRSWDRTLSSGCRCPQAGGSPSAEKLYGLNGRRRQEPLGVAARSRSRSWRGQVRVVVGSRLGSLTWRSCRVSVPSPVASRLC